MARTPAIRFRPRVETLECRLTPALPATMTVGDTFSFTDANANDITVRVQGTAGTATFNGGVGVADGADIASIAITGASSNFRILFVDNTAVNPGTNPIQLGDISVAGGRTIRGIFTVDASGVDSLFVLTRFTGKGLSKNGSINVDRVAGDLNGIGFDIARLNAGQSLNIHDDLDGNVLIATDLGGSIHVGGDFTGDLEVDRDWLKTGLVAVTGPTSQWTGAVTVGGLLSGQAIATDLVNGAWQVNKNVKASARLSAGGNFTNLSVAGNFNGRITVQGQLDLDVNKNIGAKARIVAGTGAFVFAQQHVRAGSIISARGNTGFVDLDITFGDLGGTVVAADLVDVTLVAGSVLASASFQFDAGLINVATGKFGGTATGGTLDLRVGKSVTATALIRVDTIADSVLDVDSDGMRVLGGFAGILEVSSAFSSGLGAVTNVIDGKIADTARITVASPVGGADTYVFGNRLEGRLTFLGDLTQNLSIGGPVVGPNAALQINGRVLADITINGRLSFLSSYSLFDPQSSQTGNFVDGAGTVTGTLTTGGPIGAVLPSL